VKLVLSREKFELYTFGIPPCQGAWNTRQLRDLILHTCCPEGSAPLLVLEQRSNFLHGDKAGYRDVANALLRLYTFSAVYHKFGIPPLFQRHITNLEYRHFFSGISQIWNCWGWML
jgi:hypothetical protein